MNNELIKQLFKKAVEETGIPVGTVVSLFVIAVLISLFFNWYFMPMLIVWIWNAASVFPINYFIGFFVHNLCMTLMNLPKYFNLFNSLKEN